MKHFSKAQSWASEHWIRADGSAQGDYKPRSPGMKYKHYAPKAQMTVIEGRREKVKSEIERLKALNELPRTQKLG